MFDGSNDFRVTLRSKYHVANATHVYLYVYGGSWIQSQPVPDVPCKRFVYWETDRLQLGVKYIVKWYNGNGIFAKVIAQSQPIMFLDMDTKIKSMVDQRTKELDNKIKVAEVAAGVKEAVAAATAAVSLKRKAEAEAEVAVEAVVEVTKEQRR